MEAVNSVASRVIEANNELQEHQNSNRELRYEYDEKLGDLKELST